MSDDRRPDEIPDAAFAGLGLDSLTDGVHPTADQWSTIATAASRRRQRRAWVLAAAAVLVLVAGTATVLLDRRGDDATVDIASGRTEGDERYVIPPDSATEILVRNGDDATSSMTFKLDGRLYALTQQSPAPETTDGTTFIDGLEPGTVQHNGTSVHLPGTGMVFLGCSGTSTRPEGEPRIFYSGATWLLDGSEVRLQPLEPNGNPTDCGWPDLPDDVVRSQELNQVLVRAVSSMRVVDDESRRAFVTENGWVEPPDTGDTGTSATAPPIAAAMAPYALPPADATDLEGLVDGDLLVLRFALPDGTRMHLSRSNLGGSPPHRATEQNLVTLLGVGQEGHPGIDRVDSDAFGTVYIRCGGGAAWGGNSGIEGWDYTTSAQANWLQDGHVMSLSLDGPTQYEQGFRCPIPSQREIVLRALDEVQLVDRADVDAALDVVPLTVGRSGRAIAPPGR